MATLQTTTFAGTANITLPAGNNSQRLSPVTGMLRYNNQSGTALLEFYDGTNWRPVTGYSAGTIGTGGNQTYYRNNGIVHLFTATGAHTFTPTFTGTVQVLVVAGGGGTQQYNWRGGGGGGGFIFNRAFPVTAGTPYPITVGGGGGDGNGGNSVFSSLTAIGGGQGGRWDGGVGQPGGSGGGGGNGSVDGSRGPIDPGIGTSGQGFPGGSGRRFNTSGDNAHWGGAGGGAGGGGDSAPDARHSPDQEVCGGPGAATDILGPTLYFGGGGGGGAHHGGGHCNGGIGGGGGGAVHHSGPYPNRSPAGYQGAGGGQSLNNGQPALGQTRGGAGGTNTGGGGGGGDHGSPGGPGVVIVRY
jgi:hypothetical protein